MNNWLAEQIRKGGGIALLEEYFGNIVVGIITHEEVLMIAFKEPVDTDHRITSVGLKLLDSVGSRDHFPSVDDRNAGARRELPHFVISLKDYHGRVALFVKTSSQEGKRFLLQKQ